jgi:hypothetical protein
MIKVRIQRRIERRARTPHAATGGVIVKLPVLAQQPHRVPVQGNQPAAGRRLRRANRDHVAVGDALLLDHRHPGVEVDGAPAQPGSFTAAQAAQGDQPPSRQWS